MRSKLWTLLALVLLLPLTMGAEKGCTRDTGRTAGDGRGGVRGEDGKCYRKKLAGMGGLEKQDPDPSKLGCDEKILYLYVAATGRKQFHMNVRHNAWGRMTHHTAIDATGHRGQYGFEWKESVVTFVDQDVELIAAANIRDGMLNILCAIYDQPPPWTHITPVDMELIGENQMYAAHATVHCNAYGKPIK